MWQLTVHSSEHEDQPVDFGVYSIPYFWTDMNRTRSLILTSGLSTLITWFNHSVHQSSLYFWLTLLWGWHILYYTTHFREVNLGMDWGTGSCPINPGRISDSLGQDEITGQPSDFWSGFRTGMTLYSPLALLNSQHMGQKTKNERKPYETSGIHWYTIEYWREGTQWG